MLAYSLNNNLSSERIIKDIQKLINDYFKNTKKEALLVISIKEISQESNELIPKLEYKKDHE